MAENPLSPRTPPKTLADRLSQTGSKIADLSKQAATATKEAVVKMTENSKEAVSSAIEAKKERSDEKLTKKIEETRAELKQVGTIETVPVMVTLPEFEEQRMAVMAEEHDVLVELVDHMHALSKRVDQLEHTYRALAIEDKAKLAELSNNKNRDPSQSPTTSEGMTSALSLLGASLVWVVMLTGIDRYATSHALMLFESYPAEIPIWGLGAGSWVMFVLHQLGKSAPFLRVSKPMLIQTGLAVGITTMMALLLSDNTISTMSGVWTWGTAIAVAVLVSSSLVASAWRNTRRLLRPHEEVELID
jgi:hypothetical protein